MKIKIAAMILALGLAVVASAQDKTSCPEKVTYDRFEDKTREICGGFVPKGHKQDEFSTFGVNGLVEYKGQTRQPPFFVSLHLLASEGTVKGFPKLRFDDVKSMFILTDTGRAELPLIEYKNSGSELQDGKFIIEFATVSLSQKALDYILSAKTVEARVGPEEFKFDAEGLRAFQDYLKTILPPLTMKPAPPVRRRRP